MSLDDKFNPNDGSLIDRIDSFFFDVNRKMAETWQNKTYLSKDKLEEVLYLSSSLSSSVYVVNILVNSNINDGAGYIMLFPALTSFLKYSFKIFRPKSSIQEQMTMESMGLPSKTGKYVNTLLYSLGFIDLSIGMIKILTGLTTNNNELYTDSISNFTFSLGAIAWVSGDYIAKSDIGNPPKKQKKKSILESIKELKNLFPKPALKPVTTNYHY